MTKYILHKEKSASCELVGEFPDAHELVVKHWGRVRIPTFDSLYNLTEDI